LKNNLMFVSKRFPEQTLNFTNSLQYLDCALKCWRKRCQKLEY